MTKSTEIDMDSANFHECDALRQNRSQDDSVVLNVTKNALDDVDITNFTQWLSQFIRIAASNAPLEFKSV